MRALPAPARDIFLTLTQIASLHSAGFRDFEIVKGITRPTVGTIAKDAKWHGQGYTT